MPHAIVWLALAMASFVGSHLLLSSVEVRRRGVSALGELGYLGLYSAVIGLAFAWTLSEWSTAPHLALWAPRPWTRFVPLLGMPVVVLGVVAGYTTASPTLLGALGQEREIRGVLTITRHPANLSMALWGLLHLPPNGDLASVILFGGVALLGVVGSVHIDRRRRVSGGEAWARFEAVTSLVPFAALLAGRVRYRPARYDLARVGLAALVFVGALLFHPQIIGASPWPVCWERPVTEALLNLGR